LEEAKSINLKKFKRKILNLEEEENEGGKSSRRRRKSKKGIKLQD